MPVETPVNYVTDLVPTNPVHTDALAQADSHLRAIKTALKNTFPNANGAITASHADLDHGFVPIGGVIMWSGSLGSIPANWHICDGTAGTVNLEDRFVIAAGPTYVHLTTGGAASWDAVSAMDGAHIHTGVVTDSQGAHDHAGSSAAAHTLTIDEMPSHFHFGGAQLLGQPNGLNGTFSSAGASVFGEFVESSAGGDQPHSHTLTVLSDGAHTHNVGVPNTGSVHQHTVTVPTIPPYYALAYIQRIS